MSRKLYFECRSGISGDMAVAALLDLGADREALERALDSLPLEGFRYEITRVKKSGLDVCDFNVILDRKIDNHDHDMEYLHGHGAGEAYSHEHFHSQEPSHPHSHGSEGEHIHEQSHPHVHEHRGLKEILEILDQGDMTEGARETAKKIFRILGEAEAKAHGVSIDQVHFHEVGAVDSIVDIVAAAVCADSLDIRDVVIPCLYEGCGTVRCQHGILPVPVPAVANIIEARGLSVRFMDLEGEFVTPTGAAIAAALKTEDQLPARFKILKTGMGAGKRTYERPSILRAMIIEAEDGREEQIYKLETNIDDCTGEALGYTMQRLLEAGARDVHYTPVFMKKNRPAYELNVICTEEKREELEHIIFEETTSIGIRRIPVERTVLDRRMVQVDLPWGKASLKICGTGTREWVYPEYESVAELAKKAGIPFAKMYQIVKDSAL
ncbi:MAG TPA: nickel pincer cofactor biosynthesis protein LarC [Candidatus Choladousia intestinavium]|uniref:Pyridinium-3,5-bisthiocarboxylic acid mononucleotide nickel insertion protein n=1 Tax=Candidatus Choladousia intestinavium TaxID=2840727 RepID=A0A9D1AB89_9FIRM|nr:nickel pincer cofactor biosynthesis protein LarC [Candidatus Choladousia intestinavium]